MWLVTYLRLKVSVSVLRLYFRIFAGLPPRVTPPDYLHIPSRDPKRRIRAHVYRPQSAAAQPSAVLINLHASGYVLPLHGTDDAYCKHVASTTPYTVLDVAYRLAPENPFPAAVEDVEDVVRYVLDRPAQYDRGRLSISGFSAGGALSLVASGVLFPRDTFRAVVAFYPPCDLSILPAKKHAPRPPRQPVIPPSMARLFDACYMQPGTRSDDPRVSPAFIAPDRFPSNMAIFTGECDSLAPEANELAGRISAVPGRNVVHKMYEDCDHEWDKGPVPGSIQDRAKQDAYKRAVEVLLR